jgi:hypothetical protein
MVKKVHGQESSASAKERVKRLEKSGSGKVKDKDRKSSG